MKTMTAALILSLSLAASNHSAQAQAAKRDRVAVTCDCEDATGKAYLHALQAALAKSPRYREASAKESVEASAIRISIVSMPMEPDNDGRSPRAALSIVCLDDAGGMIHQFIQTCTKIPIDSCAESMLTTLQKWQSAA